jgi:hypothetical protein
MVTVNADDGDGDSSNIAAPLLQGREAEGAKAQRGGRAVPALPREENPLLTVPEADTGATSQQHVGGGQSQ